jgi:serine/threonine-protein kinase HipA
MNLEVRIGDRVIGMLSHDSATDRFAFEYASTWQASHDRFALAPQLPLTPAAATTLDMHSGAVRRFFENLLPEGDALDAAAASSKVSKSNVTALLLALGREMAGAITIHSQGVADPAVDKRRRVTRDELSRRIRERPEQPFSVWDGRVRLSIAGYQDKLALYVNGGEWYLTEGGGIASTHIVKPEPVRQLAGLTSNEFFCMRLAEAVGLPAASVDLEFVPEPVLIVTRFDRRPHADRVERVHVVDGCQALGLAVGFKYERPFGGGRDVRHIRDGASLPRLFAMLGNSARPLIERRNLLRWALFQVLIGNADAHAKNLTFFSASGGLSLAPAYDLVSVHGLGKGVDASYAMAIGDAFTAEELSPYEWACFGAACGLPRRALVSEILRLSNLMLTHIESVYERTLRAGADDGILRRLTGPISAECRRHIEWAGMIRGVDLAP